LINTDIGRLREVTEISGQKPKDLILVRETPSIQTGKFIGYTPKGEVVVETSPHKTEHWAKNQTKTVQQLIDEKNKQIGILGTFSYIQDQIIKKLTASSKIECPETRKTVNYHA